MQREGRSTQRAATYMDYLRRNCERTLFQGEDGVVIAHACCQVEIVYLDALRCSGSMNLEPVHRNLFRCIRAARSSQSDLQLYLLADRNLGLA